jgi:rubredoxin
MPRTREQALANLAVHFRRLREDAVYRAKWRYNIRNANRSPEKRAKSAANARAVNARRVRCETCGLVSSPGAIGKHQSVTGHQGRELLHLSRDGIDRCRERGREGQTEHARRWSEDRAYREAVSSALSDAMTPERRADNAERMRELQRRRYECTDCGYVSTASNVARHQKKAGHTNRSKIPT